MADLRYKSQNESKNLKIQIINTFKLSANEITMPGAFRLEDNSIVINSKNAESEEPVGNNNSNLWYGFVSKKTTERGNFNEIMWWSSNRRKHL